MFQHRSSRYAGFGSSSSSNVRSASVTMTSTSCSAVRNPASAKRWSRSASVRRRARASDPSTSDDTAWAWPCSSLASHDTVTPASDASSSRRRPAARRRSAGKPTVDGSTRERRDRKNSPSSGARTGRKVLLAVPPPAGDPSSQIQARPSTDKATGLGGVMGNDLSSSPSSSVDARSAGFISGNPGRDVQRIGTARFLGEDPAKIHCPVWGVVGNLGESQCYLGVTAKVAAIHSALSDRVGRDDLPVRLIAPAYTLGVSDGQLNGTEQMRYSLIGRELANDCMDVHLHANDVAGVIAVVACDKPPVGTLAAILEHNAPAVVVSDGSIRPGIDPATSERIDLVGAFQFVDDPDPATLSRIALHACPGQGSCGGMFTYNTMQTFMAVLGMEPLDMVAPPSDDPRRLNEFPARLVDNLLTMSKLGIRPRDIVTASSLRNALI